MDLRAQVSAEGADGALPLDVRDGWTEANRAGNAPGRGSEQRWILSISEYAALSDSREALLKLRGFGVISTSSREFAEILERQQFDVAVLCQSIPSERVQVVTATLRRHAPGLPILRVLPVDPGAENVRYDCCVRGAAGVVEFLDAVQRLCRETRP